MAWEPANDEADGSKQDEYSILNSKHFIGIHGYMLVYSVGSMATFDMIQVIRDKILNHLVRHHTLFLFGSSRMLMLTICPGH